MHKLTFDIGILSPSSRETGSPKSIMNLRVFSSSIKVTCRIEYGRFISARVDFDHVFGMSMAIKQLGSEQTKRGT